MESGLAPTDASNTRGKDWILEMDLGLIGDCHWGLSFREEPHMGMVKEGKACIRRREFVHKEGIWGTKVLNLQET